MVLSIARSVESRLDSLATAERLADTLSSQL